MLGNSLRTKILLLFLGLMIASSIATLAAVMVATDRNVERQVAEKLQVGVSVFERLMRARSDQLFNSAQVLTADFGFKQAVAIKDAATIESALHNQGERIQADLMMLKSLTGELIADTLGNEWQRAASRQFAFTDLLPEARNNDGLQTVAMLNNELYQVVVVPVKAPIRIAWALIGFRIDSDFAAELKQLTSLDISFVRRNDADSKTLVSTLPRHDLALQDFNISASDTNSRTRRFTLLRDQYLARTTLLSTDQTTQLSAIVSASLTQEMQKFLLLKQQIGVIALLVLLCSLAAVFFVAKSVTRPLNRLADAAQRISSGDYSEVVTLDKRAGVELEALAGSFNLMQSGIAERESRIVHQLHHDALTDLPNRISVSKSLQTMLDDRTLDAQIAVVSIHFNRLKQINDVFGYKIGDQLLQSCAAILVELTACPNIVGRLSASEFVFLRMVRDESELPSLVAQLLERLSGPVSIGELDINISINVGVAMFPLQGSSAEQLLRRSDIALNRAVDKNTTCAYYEQGEDEKHLKQVRLVNDLKKAIDGNELVMYYQPKFDLRRGKVTQVEALIRWFHKDLGFIPPDEFIGLAEQSGLMPMLTRWILQQVVNQTGAWHREGLEIDTAVNLSAHDLMHDDLPGYVKQLMSDAKLAHRHLILEVTESAVMQDPEYAIKVLNCFKAANFSIAIDDYGTGYSSLGQLKKMPVDELKIDMCFIRNLTADTDDQIIVKSTIEMAHNIGLSVVAEGVEDQSSWQLLEGWGCDKLQGYYISKPIAASDFVAWYHSYSQEKEEINIAANDTNNLHPFTSGGTNRAS